MNLRVEKTQDPSGTALAPVLISKAPYILIPRSGKKLFFTLPTGPIEGMWSNKTRVFAAAGGVVYEVFGPGVVPQFNVIGNIQIGTNPVTFVSNGNQLLICSAGNVYIATGTALYQPIINYQNGFCVVTGNTVTWTSGTNQFSGSWGTVVAGDYFQLGPDRFIVTSVTDATHLVLNLVPTEQGPQFYQIGNELLLGATCTFIDGYFIVNIPNSKKFRISNPEDGTQWDEIDVAEKSGSTDNIATVADAFGQLALIGDNNSTEIWGDSGNANFPFERINGRTLKSGTAAAWSVAQLPDGSLCWLLICQSGENQVIMYTGGQPIRISDHAIENSIRKYSKVFDGVASTYLENGHAFYRIDFPAANRTWEYDATTGIWAEIGVETPADEVYGCDHGRFIVHVTWPNTGQRMNLAGDFASGKIWQVDPDFVDDDGVDFPVMRIGPHVHAYLERQEISKFALDCELGTIDPNAVGLDGKPLIPTVNLAYSVDGANTWAQAGAASLGRAGEYEGTFLTPDQQFDLAVNSQTNPQAFESVPAWSGLGAFKISWTPKIKSTGRYLRAIYNGLVDIKQTGPPK